MSNEILVRIIDRRVHPVTHGHEIWTTLEGENVGGSIKDHMVLGELTELRALGVLRPGDGVVEMSAGSTARSLAVHSRAFGLECSLFVPTGLSPDGINYLRHLGAEVHPVNPSDAREALRTFVRGKRVHAFNQFGDKALSRHYECFVRSILSLRKFNVIVGAVGTGHSLSAFAKVAKALSLDVYSAEPMGKSSIPGIRNLRLESLGIDDPCDSSQFCRHEVPEAEYFDAAEVETDRGLINITPSFRVVLGSLSRVLGDKPPLSVFAIGAANKRVT